LDSGVALGVKYESGCYMVTAGSNSRIAFGLYEVDLQSEELWKNGFRVKLQSQPFKILTALLERPGQIVTREELQSGSY
jgi:DNA-binding response OmpR family regulator